MDNHKIVVSSYYMYISGIDTYSSIDFRRYTAQSHVNFSKILERDTVRNLPIVQLIFQNSLGDYWTELYRDL